LVLVLLSQGSHFGSIISSKKSLLEKYWQCFEILWANWKIIDSDLNLFGTMLVFDGCANCCNLAARAHTWCQNVPNGAL